MMRRFSINFALFSIGFDLILIALSLFTAVYIRPAMSVLPFAKEIPDTPFLPWFIYLLFPLFWVTILLVFSVYDGRDKLIHELRNLTLGSILAAVSIAGLLYLTYRDTSRLLFLVFILLTYFLLICWRVFADWVITQRRPPESQHKVLVIGAGKLGREVETHLKNSLYPNYKTIGFLDDNPETCSQELGILGTIPDARTIVEKNHVTDIVIALPQKAHQRISKLVTEMHTLPIKVWVIPDYLNLAMHKAKIENFAGLPMLDLRAPALSDYQRMLKRVFDISITLLTAPIILLLSAMIAIAIRLDSEGSIIFKQKRVGENGVLFEMYKFRTMITEPMPTIEQKHPDTPEPPVVHKIRNDPRVTRVGQFLRRTSLDEIPQLFNTLKGDMSLVGPRPELPFLVDRYDLWQRQRFAVPQGITGWWQINGRSDRPMHEHTEDDLYYVQNYSILLDIYILLKTIIVVVRGEGAF
jgi:exopolysaccharide biosynthesis polyprenyl glycosylphosphotransferase